MPSTICLNQNFSTTRFLTKETPSIENCLEDQFEMILFLPENENRKGEGGLRTKGYFKKSYEEKPLISIITVVFNGEKYLEHTIQSVINQTYDNVEYIVIDGGSSDSTLEIIKKYEDKIDYWVSEGDKGIYDAMNKGISLCIGKYIGMINSDDYYNENTIEKVVKHFKNDNIDIIYGDMMLHDEKQGTSLLPAHKIGVKNKFFPYSMHWILIEMIIPHPTMFVASSFYRKVGVYDEKYRIAADYKFVLNAHNKKARFYYLRDVLAHFRVGGISTSTEKETILIEMCKARIELYGNPIGPILNKMISFMLLLKSNLRKYI